MRHIFDNLVARTIIILVLGILSIVFDIFLISYLVGQQQQSILDWIIVLSVEITGLIFVAKIISNQLIKPLKQLSNMAQRFSIDMQTQQLELKGPIEVREATQSFNQMQTSIQNFVEQRMQLIAAISHDLRTPLTRLLLRIDAIPDKDQQSKARADIEEMRNMIQSTLDFIRNDSSSEQKIKIDLASLVRTVCDNTSDTFGLAIYSGPDKCIQQGKPNAIKRALYNVVENAVKYGDSAQAKLECDNNTTKITIDDRGPGIDENEFDKVFLPFYRIEHSRNRETGGVGLGLSVAQTIIQGCGGTITLHNIEPTGLRVCITLPDCIIEKI